MVHFQVLFGLEELESLFFVGEFTEKSLFIELLFEKHALEVSIGSEGWEGRLDGSSVGGAESFWGSIAHDILLLNLINYFRMKLVLKFIINLS